MDSWRALVDWIYPKSCGLCSRLLVDSREDLICSPCRLGLPAIEHACGRCGAPVADPRWDPLTVEMEGDHDDGTEASGDRVLECVAGQPATTQRAPSRPRQRSKSRRAAVGRCEFCKTQRFAFDQVMSYCVYRDGAVRATRLIKEARYEALARCIGDLLGEWLMAREAFSPIHYDCVIPIPQHWIRRWTHRYNQAEVLAEGIGRRIDRPIEPGWLQRTRWTPKQGLQTIEERRQNMVSVFGVRSEKAVRGKRVLLVDDVMTSGATLQDATRALKEAGAIGVSAVVFARGVSARGAAGSRVSGPSMAGGRAGGKSVDASGPGGHRGNGPTEMSPGGDPDRPEVGESLFKRRKIH